MRFVKIIFPYFLFTFLLIIFIEVTCGISRIFLNKNFILPFTHQKSINYEKNSPYHPCNEFKTDTFLGHVHNHQNKCDPKKGKVFDQYVTYDISSKKNPILLTLGGSTTDGFFQYISNGDTFPKILAELSKDDFYLINGGNGAYNSFNELSKFVKDGPRFNNLKVVVSLNGINELITHSGSEKTKSKHYPFLGGTQYLMNERQIWLDIRYFGGAIEFILPNSYSLYRYFIENIKGNKIREDVKSIDYESINFFNEINVADRWEININRMNSLVELENAKYYVFLQPTMGLKGSQSKTIKGTPDHNIYIELSEEYKNERRILYGELKKRCEKIKFCYDISDLAPPKGNYYYGPRHHNENGNKIIADKIWEIINMNKLN